MSEPIPITVVGGYLGAGKTTLVNHLLRSAGGLRIAVLVNDFGELAIDADLIESRSGGVISIAGGCVCCSFGSDLIAALMNLPAQCPAPPEHVLVETSGIALPAAVTRSAALLPAYRPDGTVVLADAETVRSRAADRYVGDTITRQLGEADIVVLNKVDLVQAEAREALVAWLREQAPRARVVSAERAQVPREVVLGPMRARVKDAAWPQTGKLQDARATVAPASFESAAYRPQQPLDVARLAQALCDPALGVVRAKGRLQDVDGSWKTLHVVGSRHEVSDAPAGAETAGLVCIGPAGALRRSAIERVIARCGAFETGTRLQAEGGPPG